MRLHFSLAMGRLTYKILSANRSLVLWLWGFEHPTEDARIWENEGFFLQVLVYTVTRRLHLNFIGRIQDLLYQTLRTISFRSRWKLHYRESHVQNIFHSPLQIDVPPVSAFLSAMASAGPPWPLAFSWKTAEYRKGRKNNGCLSHLFLPCQEEDWQ